MNSLYTLSIISLSLLLLAAPSLQAEMKVSGAVSSYAVYRVVDIDDLDDGYDEEWMKFENKVKAEIKYDQAFGPIETTWAISTDAFYDPYAPEFDSDFTVSDEDAALRLREAYVEISHEKYDLDLRIGNQVVVWGKSDGMPVTDIVTPLDLMDFIMPDYEDLRIAIPLVKANYYINDYTLEAIFIPWFYPNEIADSGNWLLEPNLDTFERKSDIGIGGIKTVKHEPENEDAFEYGFKLSGFRWDTDFSFMFFKTTEDIPTVVMPPKIHTDNLFDLNPATPIFTADLFYNRMEMYGMTFSRPASSFVLRGEAAFYKGKQFPSMDAIHFSSVEELVDMLLNFDELGRMYEKEYLHWMIGTDFSGIRDVTISGQFEQKRILGFNRDESLRNVLTVQKLVVDYDETHSLESLIELGDKLSGPDGLQEETENSITLVVQKGDAIQNKFFTQVIFMKNLTAGDYLIKLNSGYSIRQGLWIYFGYNMLEGDDDTAFGIFNDNDNLYLKVKYSF